LISRLQNSVILLVFEILKILNICFVGNLILGSSCKFHDDDITVMSFINMKYGDVDSECRYCIFVGKKYEYKLDSL